MPQALPIIALGAGLLGTAASTIGGIQQAKFQAKVAKRNAQIAETNAQNAAFRSQVEGQEQDRISRALIGEEVSRQAASGLALSSGSFALQRKTLGELARKDTLTIRQAGDVEAANFLNQAAASRAEAKLAKRSAVTTGIAGGLSAVGQIAGSSLVSGALTTRKAGFDPRKLPGGRGAGR